MATYRTTYFYSDGSPRVMECDIPSEGPAPALTTKPRLPTRGADEKSFLLEAEAVGVLTPTLADKIRYWFAKKEEGVVGEGMTRMQCRALINNAIKKREKSNAQPQ